MRVLNITLLLLFAFAEGYSLKPVLSSKQMSKSPPRIIRTCCSFGADVKIAGVPFVKLTEITSIEKIGKHVYMGDKTENNGIVYTESGGFIDLGHLRDQADWTAYLYSLMLSVKPEKKLVRKLSYEGGKKTLHVKLDDNLSDFDLLLLSGRIAYDLSVWHEIATWFGTSYLPFVPERYSSFSVEDNYSNLLGVILGIEAVKSDLPYEEAMTKLLYQKLLKLKVVESEEATYEAMKSVENLWWTNQKKLPAAKILKERYLEINTSLKPWLVPKNYSNTKAYSLSLPAETSGGISLCDLYEIRFKLNHKFPLKAIFPEYFDRTITQKDFELLMHYVKQDLTKRLGEKKQSKRKEIKQEFKKLKKDTKEEYKKRKTLSQTTEYR